MSTGYNKRAARVDGNHSDIKRDFELLGCSVADTSGAGDGFPDLVVGFVTSHFPFKVNVLVEVKDGSKPPSERKLTPKQKIFHDNWIGPIEIVKDQEDVIRVVRKYRNGNE